MGSTVKRLHASSNRNKGHTVIEGFDEENRTYFTVLKRPAEKRSKILLNASLEDVPLEARRKEAGKRLYITRYE
jgi:hypothetical protein